jgi:DNA-binding response OmpR family regulator
MRLTHEAQVIPSTGNDTISMGWAGLVMWSFFDTPWEYSTRPRPARATEFDILALLGRAPGVVRSRGEILEAVWDQTFVDDDHLVDVHVANLRRKLGEGFIETVRGVGYRLAVS